LLADNGTNWLGPVTLGGSGSVANSACSIAAAGASHTPSGNTSVFTLPVTFQTSFTGAKSFQMLVTDSTGLQSGWQTLGSWTPCPNLVPRADSVTPSSGTGFTATLQYSATDGNGAQDFHYFLGVINSSLYASPTCYFQYDPNSNKLWLANDQVTGWPGPITLGGTGTLENSQCTIDAAGSSLSVSGNTITFSLKITFNSSYSGARNVYLLAQDKAGANSGWVALGSWTVP
jgi:hypothetical protein